MAVGVNPMKRIFKNYILVLALVFSCVPAFQGPASTGVHSVNREAPASPKKKEKNYWDYWQDIYFSSVHFQETINKVDSHYIDRQKYNRNLCYVEAARYALYTLKKTMDIFPDAYMKRRAEFEKDDMLSGRAVKIHPDDPFIVFIADDVKKENDKGKPTPQKKEDIKTIIQRVKKRRLFLTEAWKKIDFGERAFRGVLNYIIRHHRHDEKFDLQKIYVKASLGYLHGLDPHCSLLPRAFWDWTMAQIQDSSFSGIGALLQGGGVKPVMVVNPMEGYPAVKAGVRSGDVILKVDGKDIAGLLLDEVVSRIRGPRGKTVVLTLKRTGVKKPIKVPIVRGFIKVENVSGKILDSKEGIIYIKMRGFVGRSTSDFYRLFVKHQEQGPVRALIFDLRGNGGGLLEQAVRMTNLFLKSGKIVTIRSSAGKSYTHQATPQILADHLAVVVLVDSLSASASEILASALQDHGRALILGTRSFGKATVQKLIPNTASSQYTYFIKLTTERYYAPSDRTIQVVGVVPDVRVPVTPDGGFPYQYREEDSWNHLPPIQRDYISGNHKIMPALKQWVHKNGRAAADFRRHQSAAIQPDFQILVAADYARALLANKVKK